MTLLTPYITHTQKLHITQTSLEGRSEFQRLSSDPTGIHVVQESGWSGDGRLPTEEPTHNQTKQHVSKPSILVQLMNEWRVIPQPGASQLSQLLKVNSIARADS